MENNKISIIIIAYNEEKYISGILDSLCNQTVHNFEVIVIDSNSNDNTETVANSFAKCFKEFRFVKLDKTNGPAYARNKGAELVKYETIIFLDADTRLNPDFLERIYSEITAKKINVATCRIRILEDDLLSDIGAYFLNLFLFLFKFFYSSAYGACLISSKTVHEKLGGFDENIGVCEDCNYVKKARRIHHFKFGILNPYFYTSHRRAKSEGGLAIMYKYIKIHLYRMVTGKEILKNKIEYQYGNF